MDPFTALGVAAAVIQFVEFGTKVGRQMLSMYSDNRVDQLEYFQKTTNDLQDYLSLLETRPRRPVSKDSAAGRNEEAINKLVGDCRDVAKNLTDIFNEITSISEQHDKYEKSISRVAYEKVKESTGFNKAVNSTLQAIKYVWNEDEIEQMKELLNTCRNQIVLRILLSLDSKANETLEQNEMLNNNVSDVVEILAVYQERQKSATTNQTKTLENRIDDSDALAKRYHDETIAAILTLKDGHTRIIDPGRRLEGAITGLGPGLGQKVVQFRCEPRSSYPDASVDDFKPVEDRILHSLYFRQMTDRMETVRDPHTETYEWIFCDPVLDEKPWDDFMKWLANGSGCYWICGKAGSGKSTLMKFVYHDLRTTTALRAWAGEDQLIPASFFFWGLGNGVQKSQEGLLRSILYDILKKEPHLIPLVMTELLPVATNMTDGERLSEPSLAELMKWFRRLLELDHHRRYFFLIDGIDEYDGDPSTIVELVSSVSKKDNVKFLLSSRPIPVCVENFSPFPKLHLHDLTRDDIRRYAEDTLSHRLRQKGSKWTSLIDQIVEKSSGVFIWVELSVKSLLRGLENRDNMAELQRRLDELPSDLADLYSHMLKDMSPMYRKQAAHLFRLTLESMRIRTYCPLTALQMSFAEEDHTEHLDLPIDPISKEEELSRSDEIGGRIRSRCCGLLETRRARPSEQSMLARLHFDFPVVDFLHRTVVEFLADADVSKGITELSESSFIPSATLFHSCARMCKAFSVPKSIDANSNLVWHMMRNAFYFASLSEDSRNPIPGVYLRDLDKTMSHHWQGSKKIHNDALEQKAVGHWARSYKLVPPSSSTASQLLSKAADAENMVSLAIAHLLPSFLAEELATSPSSLSKSTAEKSRHLYDATRYLISRPWKGPDARFREYEMLGMCEQLAKHGANPNTQFGAEENTAWILLLKAAKNHRESESVPFIKDFEQNGFARTIAKLITSFIIAGADVNARLVWRTKRYRDDEQPVVFKRTPLPILDGLFSSVTSSFSAGLLDAPEPEPSKLLKGFHKGLMQLLVDRGAVSREWCDDKLVSGPPEVPCDASSLRLDDSTYGSTTDVSTTASKTRVRLRHKLGSFFKKDLAKQSDG